MKVTMRDCAIITLALREYRDALEDGRLMHACKPLEVDAILKKLEQAAAESKNDDAYEGIGTRTGTCFCRTCQTIIEGQLRDVLTRLPDDQRRDVVERVESSIGDGVTP